MEIISRESPSSGFLPEGVKILPPALPVTGRIVTPPALAFVAKLEREFRPLRSLLLRNRIERQIEITSGTLPHFPAARNASASQSTWKVAAPPADLADRRVEVIVPAGRRAIIDGLNSDATACVIDFEDMLSPTWRNIVRGQWNLLRTVDRTLESPRVRHRRRKGGGPAIMIRPRGLHLDESHVLVDGSPVSATIFDVGMSLFHNSRRLLDRGSGPYFVLPKLESRIDARFCHELFSMAEAELNIPPGSIRVDVLIENILAAFEMEDILFELRDHATGLSLGLQDYLFSFIKKFRFDQGFTVPDRSRIGTSTHFLHSGLVLLIQTCHRHAGHAIGPASMRMPASGDPPLHERILARVRLEKEREAAEGCDGTRVAHPGLVAAARSPFDELMTGDNQLQRTRGEAEITAADLLTVPRGEITEQGIRENISTAVGYLEGWLHGFGAVPMGDHLVSAATAEISRAQLWQWIHSPTALLPGHRKVSAAFYERLLIEEIENVRRSVGESRFRRGKYHVAVSLLHRFALERDFTDFLTLAAYEHLDSA